MSEYNLLKPNGLSLRNDWLSFVVTKKDCVEDILSLFGFSMSDFILLDRGGFGYSKQLLLNGSNIRFFYEGSNPDMGIYVSVSGSAISVLYETFWNTFKDNGFSMDEISDEDVMRSCLSLILSIGHITRFDIAVDDKGGKFFSLDDIASFYKNGQIVSGFRKYERRRPEEDYKVTGDSLLFGSRSSNTYFRIYDKQLEQNSKLNGADKIDFPWVRYEFELKGDNADNFVRHFVDGIPFSECVMGVMNKYFRIIELDNENRSRCSTLKKWAEFTGTVLKLRLSVPHELKSLDDKERWFEHSCMNTVAALLIRDGGSLDFINNKLLNSLYKLLKNKHLCAQLGGEAVVSDALEYYRHVGI